MREGKIALPAVLAIDSEYSVALAVQGSSPKPAPKRTALIDVRPKFGHIRLAVPNRDTGISRK
jgi:hypothetical protein